VTTPAAARGNVAAHVPDRDSALPDALLRTGARLGVAGVAVQTVAHLVGVALGRTIGQLDLDAGGTVWSWASSSVTAVGAAALVAGGVVSRRWWRPAFVLAPCVAFLSADDAVQIHERLRFASLGLHEGFRLVWPGVYLPLLAVTFVSGWRLAPSAGTATARRAIRRGLGVLAFAIACELASTWLVEDVGAILEEGAELLGWTLVASGLAAGVVEIAADHGRTRSLR